MANYAVMPRPNCPICNKSIPNRKTKFCSDECKLKSTSTREKNRRAKIKSLNPKKCLVCQNILGSKKVRYCSSKCRISDKGKRCYKAFIIRNNEKKNKTKMDLIVMFGGSCQHCGYCKNSAALQFHHKDPKTKSFGLSSSPLQTKTWEEIVQEANKCLLLCANCHAEVHNPAREII